MNWKDALTTYRLTMSPSPSTVFSGASNLGVVSEALDDLIDSYYATKYSPSSAAGRAGTMVEAECGLLWSDGSYLFPITSKKLNKVMKFNAGQTHQNDRYISWCCASSVTPSPQALL